MRNRNTNSTYRIRRKQTRSARNGTNVPATFDEVDRVDVVRVDDAGATETTHELCEDVRRDLAPREVAEGRKRDGDRGVDVPAGNTTRDPDTEGGTDRPAKVQREVVLWSA